MRRNYKIVRLYKYFVLITAFIFSFACIGFSNRSPFDAFNIESVNLEPVCYNASTSVQYYTIEDALNNATSGQTINTYVGKNPTIRKNVTIKPGVTLTLAFDDNGGWNGRQSGSDASKRFDDGGSNFADYSSASVAKYRKNSIKIAKNVTLNNNGTINIAGVLGAENIGLSGHTSGNYAEFVLSSNATIINNGTINCMGYIKEESIDNNSKLIVESGTVYSPFIIHDYRGGSSTAGSYKNGGITPFNVFDMPNIKVLSRYSYNSRLIGYADLHTGTVSVGSVTLLDAQHNSTDIGIIGNSSSVITLTSQNSYVEAKYNYSSLLYTEKANYSDFMDIKVYGGASSGVMKLTVKLPTLLGGNTTVSTENCFFPINYRVHLSLNDGTYRFINPMKVLTGGEIFINQDATLSVNSDLIIYPDTFVDTEYGGIRYPNNLPAGKFCVDGQVTYAAGIGGFTETTSAKTDYAYIYENSSTTTVSSSEGHAERSNLSFNYIEHCKVTETATAYINDNGNLSKQNLEQTVYVSEGNTNYFIKASNLGSYTINYHLNGGTINGESTTNDIVTKEYPIMKGISIELNSFSIDEPTKRFYKFKEWRLTSETGNPAYGTIVSDGTNLDIYASYDIGVYKINYSVEYKDEAEMSENYANNNITSFTKDDLPITITKPTDGSYYFYGWYYNNDTSSEILTLTSELSYIGYGDINLDGYFSNKIMAKVTFNANGHEDYFENLSSYNIITSNPKEINLPTSKYDSNVKVQYYLSGWKDQNDVIFDSSTYVFPGDSVELSAVWTQKINVNYFDFNGNKLLINYYKPDSVFQLQNYIDVDPSYKDPYVEGAEDGKSTFYKESKITWTINNSEFTEGARINLRDYNNTSINVVAFKTLQVEKYLVSVTNKWNLWNRDPSIWIRKYDDDTTTYLQVAENAGTDYIYLENHTKFDVWVGRTGSGIAGKETIKITYSDGTTSSSYGNSERIAFNDVEINGGPIYVTTT